MAPQEPPLADHAGEVGTAVGHRVFALEALGLWRQGAWDVTKMVLFSVVRF